MILRAHNHKDTHHHLTDQKAAKTFCDVKITPAWTVAAWMGGDTCPTCREVNEREDSA